MPPPPVRLSGRPAAPGIAAGPIHLIGRPPVVVRQSGGPEEEAAKLRTAIGEAIRGIEALIGSADEDGSGILAFQVAVLEDDALSAPAYGAIAEGRAANEAWVAAVESEIAGYEASSDPHFRARAADLGDIRDRVLLRLAGVEDERPPPGAILAGTDVTPTQFLSADWTCGGGLALLKGSSSSHVAMLARSRGVPMVVSLGDIDLSGHREAIVDGEAGVAILSPSGSDHRETTARTAELVALRAKTAAAIAHPAVTTDGTRVAVLLNVAGTDELDRIDQRTCDGIGLMRSEFLFRDGASLPDEEMQYAAYRRFVEWAGGKPVTIRTLDVGGDKPISGLTPNGETNPFLGLRGIRLSLARPEAFGVQLRALARAAVHGDLKVMLPMVTNPSEFSAASALLDAAVVELKAKGIPAERPPLGMMVEVPAAALAVDLFADAAFFSIGSNDLVQYLTAAARDNGAVAETGDAAHPAVIRLIRMVIAEGRKLGKEVSLCGDMGGEAKHIPALLMAGLRSFSVAPALLAATKAAIRENASGGGDGR